MTPAVLYVLVFLACVLVFASIYSVLTESFQRNNTLIRQRLDDEFRCQHREQAKRTPVFKDLAKPLAEFLSDSGAKIGIQQRCQLTLDQSGMKITLGRLVFFAVILGSLLGGGGGLARKSLLVGSILFFIGVTAPFFFVHWRRRVRMTKLLSQLPDAFDLIARVIQVGQTPARAMYAVAEQFDRPISEEFGLCYEQQYFGLPASVVLRDLGKRNGVLELHIFVIAMLIQQQTGGSLASMMEGLAAVVRERIALREKVKVLTAEGRMQAVILMALPPLMLVAMLLINRKYAMTLFEYPWLLVAGLMSMALGALWIRKIVNFEV
jgi:tight adherence protein B